MTHLYYIWELSNEVLYDPYLKGYQKYDRSKLKTLNLLHKWGFVDSQSLRTVRKPTGVEHLCTKHRWLTTSLWCGMGRPKLSFKSRHLCTVGKFIFLLESAPRIYNALSYLSICFGKDLVLCTKISFCKAIQEIYFLIINMYVYCLPIHS